MLSVIFFFVGRMVELADTPVLGTGLARGEGSSPFSPTKKTSLSNNTGVQICCSRCCIEDKMLQSKTSLSNNTGIGSSVSLSDYETNKKICCYRCYIEDKMLQSRKGMCRQDIVSRRLVSLRN